MKSDRFTIKEFNQQFPDDAACLDYIWRQRFPNGVTCKCGLKDRFHRVTTRKCYACDCGHQISPCEGTIFHKSSTKLKTWFHVMFLMTAAKNGVSAKEIERQTGVTYKTAWRMAHQVRKLMAQDRSLILSGAVEADETHIGGVMEEHKGAIYSNKTPVAGLVERGGQIKAKVVTNIRASSLMPNLVYSVKEGSTVYTDELKSYNYVRKYGFVHARVEHGRQEWVRAEVHTNTVEGFWSQLKRSVNWTFHHVSREHLQTYVDEFAFRYNRRAALTKAPIFPKLAERAGERRD